MSIKITKFGSWVNIHNYTAKILEGFGYEIEGLENATAQNFMSKSVLAMGEIDIDYLNKILPKVRSIIYIGENPEVKQAIFDFCVEKDIPAVIEKVTFTTEIKVYRNNLKTIQIYSSNVFSEMEIASKYMAYNGTKIVNLIKYVSQVELQRTSAPFDAELDMITPMHKAFVDYYHKCEESKINFVPEQLIEIYETYKPQ